MATPLSIIVAAQESRATISACLNSLLAQTQIDHLQIIVVDGAHDGTAELVAQQYPVVRLMRMSAPRSLPHLLGVGIQEAEGDIIAITESHCVFPPDWASNVLAAHEKNLAPVIGGAVEPGPKLGWSDWALYFADYGQFMSPLKQGAASEMPGENVSFKHTVLEAARQAGADFARDGFWKTFFCQGLRQAGQTLVAAPEIVVFYNRRLSIPRVIARRTTHGRCFGGLRAKQFSASERIIIGLGGGLLPALIAIRLFRNIWPKNRYRREFIASLPLALAAIVAWSAGEWWGNLFGTGNGCDYV